jgi:hypothetical protein
MEAGDEDREDAYQTCYADQLGPATLEPGHEDREDSVISGPVSMSGLPQWSPVAKTGKTARTNGSG